MPPFKVMPLLLTAIASCVMASGVARAGDQQEIRLAQAQTPQQQEEERKRKAKEQQQLPQHQQKQQQFIQPHQAQGTPPHQPKQFDNTQKQAQDRQKLEQQKAQQELLHRQAQQNALEQKKKALEHQNAQQQHQTQDKALTAGQQLKLKEQADSQKRALDAEKLHNDKAKIQKLQQQQRNTEQQLHQQQQKAGTQQQHALQQENILHHQLSAEEQKAKVERDAHRADREKLIQKQKQMAAGERSQAAINERLKLQNERLRVISSQRQQSVDRNGQTVIKEPGSRTIIQTGGRAFIQHDEKANFKLFGGRAQTVRAPNGNSVSTIVRPDGVRIEVEVDSYGRPLRRVRILPDGRRYVLFENRAIALGVGFALGAFIVNLPPPHYDIPRDQYIVDADDASEDDIYGALEAGPVEPLDRGYSLDEVLASISLRERMRSISLDSINFEFGSWEVGPDQVDMLESVAAVMRDITNQNPGEVFLIEGHTDAVGSDIDNLSLSDRRAEAIAQVLSERFGIPRENLVTQGYGKQFLLIPTSEPERRNRRVVIRRITPLLQGDGERLSSGYGGRRD